MSTLSHRDHAGLAFITVFAALEGRAPSLHEIATALRLSSKTGAARVVQSLARQGLVEHGARGLRVASGPITQPSAQP